MSWRGKGVLKIIHRKESGYTMGENIDAGVHACIREHGYEPLGIVMHPATYCDFKKEYEYFMGILPGLLFADIQIIRSEDVPETEIRFY